MSLQTPTAIRTLQRKLYVAAKAQPDRRFHQLYDRLEALPVHAGRAAPLAGEPVGVLEDVLAVHLIVRFDERR